MRSTRRKLLISGAALLGLGTAGYGGSTAVCRARGDTQAALIRPLFVVLGDIPDAEAVGFAWLRRSGRDRLFRDLRGRSDLFRLTLMADPQVRREALLSGFTEEFGRGDTVVADRWVVARSEALIAAAWVA